MSDLHKSLNHWADFKKGDVYITMGERNRITSLFADAARAHLSCPDLTELRESITNEGSKPRYHREIQARHRREWPTLWKAIDNLLRAVQEPPQ